ncbi:MAG: hypothetical protein PHV37_06605 [Candidatus Gastranaerophilales bacterium]|nr:hypothetical protein [Candidatus Gastranaerophilales bacterium]
MDILKLAKHLKEFTLDEIEMIAECDCKTELEKLLSEHKIAFKNKKYEYIEKQNEEYSIFINKKSKNINYEFTDAVHDFLENYAKKYCKSGTCKNYRTIFNYGILPFFKNKHIGDIQINDVKIFYKKCQELNFKSRRIKNTLALLNQLLKYFQEQGFIKSRCIFQVKRLTAKNEFNKNRLIFKENL